MPILVALLLVPIAAVIARALRRPELDLSNQAIATALGRLVRDGAIVVESGMVQATSAAQLEDRRSRGAIEARTLAAVRVTGTIPIDRLFTVVRESRLH